jgi:glutathione S-transferase
MQKEAITLYFSPFTRSTRPRWLLEELGVPYELKVVNMKDGEHKTGAYKHTVHPLGRVPALGIDGRVIIESSAIVATLADRFPDKGFAPPPQSQKRADYYQWLFFGQVTIEPAVADMMATFNPANTIADDDKAKRKVALDDAIAHASRLLGEGPWLLGADFSAADCVVGSLLVWAQSKELLHEHANLVAYVERVKSRPAFQRARKV